jgi:hypothetical protein
MSVKPSHFSLLLFIGMCSSTSYWIMQLINPASQPLSAPPRPLILSNLPSAASLFGSMASNPSAYQVIGIVLTQRASERVAVLQQAGQAPQTVHVDTRLSAQVRVSAIQANYVSIVENGVTQNIALNPVQSHPQTQLTAAQP